MSSYRKKLPMKKSKKLFSRTASSTNIKNLSTQRPMRGGIRL